MAASGIASRSREWPCASRRRARLALGRRDGPGSRLRGHRPLGETRLFQARARGSLQSSLRRRIDEQHFAVIEAVRGHEVTGEVHRAREVFQVEAVELQTDGLSGTQRRFERRPRLGFRCRLDGLAVRDPGFRTALPSLRMVSSVRPRTARQRAQLDEDEAEPFAQTKQHRFGQFQPAGGEQRARRDRLAMLADEGLETRYFNSRHASRTRQRPRSMTGVAHEAREDAIRIDVEAFDDLGSSRADFASASSSPASNVPRCCQRSMTCHCWRSPAPSRNITGPSCGQGLSLSGRRPILTRAMCSGAGSLPTHAPLQRPDLQAETRTRAALQA